MVTPASFYKALPRYPATQKLSDLFKANVRAINPAAPVRTHARADVVSPELCGELHKWYVSRLETKANATTDDALKYLQPRLRQYQGCDIIDINPGACIWSERIHAALKPRTHLLLEPEKKYIEPFVKPLLDRDDSYRHSPLLPTHTAEYWPTYDKIYSEGLLPAQNSIKPDDPVLRQPNRKLLLTGNLHRMYKIAGYKKSGMVANLCTLLGHMVHGSQTNSLVHQYGLIKMLLWVPEDAKQHMLPWLIQAQGTSSVTAGLAAEINQVVGLPKIFESSGDRSTLETKPRPFVFDEISAMRTGQRMQASGMSLQPGRKPKVFEGIEKNEKLRRIASSLEINVHSPPGQDTLAGLTSAISDLEKDSAVFAQDDRRLVLQKKDLVSPQHRDIFDQNLYHPFPIPIPNRFADFMKLSKRQVEAEAAFASLSHTLSAQERGSIQSRLLDTAALVRDGIYSKATLEYKLWADRFRILFDEQRCLYLDPPVLAYDRRPYEILASKEEEFWPKIPMMLLEIDPLARNFASDITTKEQGSAIMRGLVKGLFFHRALSVWEALDHVAPGAGEDMYEAVPELRDPRLGGRLDPKDLKVYALSRALLEKLTVAYLEWPFRPSDFEMMQMGLVSPAAGLGMEGGKEEEEMDMVEEGQEKD